MLSLRHAAKNFEGRTERRQYRNHVPEVIRISAFQWNLLIFMLFDDPFNTKGIDVHTLSKSHVVLPNIRCCEFGAENDNFSRRMLSRAACIDESDPTSSRPIDTINLQF